MSKIIIDEQVRHGKPVIAGTRITVDEVLGALIGGMAYEEIEKELENIIEISEMKKGESVLVSLKRDMITLEDQIDLLNSRIDDELSNR